MFPEPLVYVHQALASGFQVSVTRSPITRRSASIVPPGLVAAAPGSHLKDVPTFQDSLQIQGGAFGWSPKHDHLFLWNHPTDVLVWVPLSQLCQPQKLWRGGFLLTSPAVMPPAIWNPISREKKTLAWHGHIKPEACSDEACQGGALDGLCWALVGCLPKGWWTVLAKRMPICACGQHGGGVGRLG